MHPLQATCDQLEKNAVMPCPFCGKDNGIDWFTCQCVLHREGWRSAEMRWFYVYDWACPRCSHHNQELRYVDNPALLPPDRMAVIRESMCDSSICDVIAASRASSDAPR